MYRFIYINVFYEEMGAEVSNFQERYAFSLGLDHILKLTRKVQESYQVTIPGIWMICETGVGEGIIVLICPIFCHFPSLSLFLSLPWRAGCPRSGDALSPPLAEGLWNIHAGTHTHTTSRHLIIFFVWSQSDNYKIPFSLLRKIPQTATANKFTPFSSLTFFFFHFSTVIYKHHPVI